MFRFLLTIVFFNSLLLLSQKSDTVHLKDGDLIIVSIQGLEETKIKYKKLNNLEGPTYTLTSDDIQYIILSNGEIVNNKQGKLVSYSKEIEVKKQNDKSPNYSDPFYDEKKDKQKNARVKRSILYNSRKNMIGFNYTSFFTLDLEFSYERIIDKVGYFGIKVPVRFNMGVQPNYLNKINIFTSGIHANIYPLGQGRFSYFTGPVLYLRIMKDNDLVTTSGNNSITITLDPTKSTYLGFYMNNGCLFRASPFLYFGLSMGFGFRKDLGRTYESSIFEMIGEASISYRF